MNIESLEVLVLLRQSGELSPEQEVELRDALTGHLEFQHRADEMDQLLNLCQSQTEVPSLPDAALQRILQQAETTQKASHSENVIPFQRRWAPLAAAAAVVLLLGGWLWMGAQQPADEDGGATQVASGNTSETMGENISLMFFEDDPISESLASLTEQIEEVDQFVSRDHVLFEYTENGNTSLEDIAAELLELEFSNI